MLYSSKDGGINSEQIRFQQKEWVEAEEGFLSQTRILIGSISGNLWAGMLFRIGLTRDFRVGAGVTLLTVRF